MNPQAAASLIKYGPIGLAAIVMLLAFYLVNVEQRRKSEPRRGIITMFWTLCGLGLVLVAGSLWREYSERETARIALQLESELAEKKTLLTRLENSSKVQNELRVELSERGGENQKLGDEVTKLRSELLALSDSAMAQKTALSKVSGENEQLSQRLTLLQTESEDLKKRLVQNNETASIASARIAETENAARMAKEENDGLKATLIKATRARYTCEETHAVGKTFVDKLTGVSLGISKISFWSNVGMFGNVMFPSGVSDTIFAQQPGKAWKYQWNGRSFTIAVSYGNSGYFKVAVQETTESL